MPEGGQATVIVDDNIVRKPGDSMGRYQQLMKLGPGRFGTAGEEKSESEESLALA